MINTIVSFSSVFCMVLSASVLMVEIFWSFVIPKRYKIKKQQKKYKKKLSRPVRIRKKTFILLLLSTINCVALIFIVTQLTDLVKFEVAVDKMNGGDLSEAQELFIGLNEDDLYLQSRYSYAKQLYNAGDISSAATIFSELGDYKDSKRYLDMIESNNSSSADSDEIDKINERKYTLAGAFLTEGKYYRALQYLEELSDYKDSNDLKEECIKLMRKSLAHTISAGIRSSVAIENDGTIVATGGNNSYDYHDWTDIISVSNKGVISIGLKEDGTVVSTGEYSVDTSTWNDIIAVSAGERYVIGLKSDGTLIGAGHDSGDGQLNVENWTDIIAIATGWRHTVGLDIDGNIFITGYGSSKQLKEINANCAQWENVIAIAAGGGNVKGKGHTVGLRADGKVVAVGDNTYGQCNVKNWDNIIAIAAGDWHTVGLRADGTVVSTCPDLNKYPDLYTAATDVSSWEGITQIAAGSGYTLGLKSDGSVVAIGYNDEGKRDETRTWQSIKNLDCLVAKQ